ncbi:DUF2004 domain-containing protein [Thermoplasma sp.]|uniref:DUF2004 domain-containing protein n=1 Tax=Thermoplasma sp. TaxID=1973142 RepID=UPI00127998EF|nr:DUF2004 domain-containing protein [Thermoplasma sp.]KAA8922172.1 MAG: DUF2004 domain-containing protein [Thermoplasma sp.]
MEKGLEIAFQTADGMDEALVQALAGVTAYDFRNMDIKYNIFLVDLYGQKYFRILFLSKKLTDLHPEERKRVREKFDENARMSYGEIMKIYHDLKARGIIVDRPIKEVREEYDLWEDPIWQYI